MKEMRKKRGERRCKMCGSSRGLIRKYNLNLCRKCFRERAVKLGFRKFGGG
ncbi:MAG: 30S ribosomal protein S14 [Candidatus Anstonellales archaeon]